MVSTKYMLNNCNMRANRIWIEKGYKGVEFTTGKICGTLKPQFENGKIGNPIRLPANIAKELFDISQERNKLEGIAWDAELSIFNQEKSPMGKALMQKHKKNLREALQQGKIVTEAYSKIIASISNQVKRETGLEPSHITLFYESAILRGHDELDTLMEMDWNVSFLRKKLLDAQTALKSLEEIKSLNRN